MSCHGGPGAPPVGLVVAGTPDAAIRSAARPTLPLVTASRFAVFHGPCADKPPGGGGGPTGGGAERAPAASGAAAGGPAVGGAGGTASCPAGSGRTATAGRDGSGLQRATSGVHTH